jgi:hypothetical protein
MESFPTMRDKGAWDWTMMMVQAGWIAQAALEETVRQVERQQPIRKV